MLSALVYPTIRYGLHIYACVSGLCFMLFTWYCCKKFHSDDVPVSQILLSIIVGRYAIDMIDRLTRFWTAFSTLHIVITCLIAIFMGWLCFKKNRPLVWVLCLMILLAYAYLMAEPWNDMCKMYIYPEFIFNK